VAVSVPDDDAVRTGSDPDADAGAGAAEHWGDRHGASYNIPMAVPPDRRVVRVRNGKSSRWGTVLDNEVFALPEGPFASTIEPGARLGLVGDLELLAPTTPTKIVCVGRNYAAHAAEHGADVPREPLLFLKPPSAVLAPGAAIELPPLSTRVEHEGELAVVIGRQCRNVSSSEAWRNVLGVTCGNDVTARDLQRADGQWTRGKGFDTFCPLGPWIVAGLTETEAADLDICCRVNGEVRQRGNTGEMAFPPAELIAAITAVMTLEPGDVVMTGTPAGVGPLTAGDVVEVEVERVGTLSNHVE
jgi:2-keto-4-pentenoate hydratase/2-oxohepta-3-ene-1,7-dioic acid hydratase in catechol pathway